MAIPIELTPSFFPVRGTGVVLAAVLYPRRRRFWYACQWVERKRARAFHYFALLLFLVSGARGAEWGGEGVPTALFSGGAYDMHASGSGRQVRGIFYFALAPFNFLERGRGLIALYSRSGFFVMHASVSGG